MKKWKNEIEQLKMEKEPPSPDTDGRYTVMHANGNQYTQGDPKKIHYIDQLKTHLPNKFLDKFITYL